jgi:hypothetical protein
MPHEFINHDKAQFSIKILDEGIANLKCPKFAIAQVHYSGKVLGEKKDFFNSRKLHAEGK